MLFEPNHEREWRITSKDALVSAMPRKMPRHEARARSLNWDMPHLLYGLSDRAAKHAALWPARLELNNFSLTSAWLRIIIPLQTKKHTRDIVCGIP